MPRFVRLLLVAFNLGTALMFQHPEYLVDAQKRAWK